MTRGIIVSINGVAKDVLGKNALVVCYRPKRFGSSCDGSLLYGGSGTRPM